MAKNTKSVNELVQKLAILADSTDNLFPEGKKMVFFELKENEYQTAKAQFDIFNKDIKKFNVDISGVEFIFIEDGSLNDEEDNS